MAPIEIPAEDDRSVRVASDADNNGTIKLWTTRHNPSGAPVAQVYPARMSLVRAEALAFGILAMVAEERAARAIADAEARAEAARERATREE